MPSFDSETIELLRRERVASHCKRASLTAMTRRELRKLEKELLGGTAEDQAQWLLNRRLTEHDIVKQCANKLGKKWLDGQQALVERNRRRAALEVTWERLNSM